MSDRFESVEVLLLVSTVIMLFLAGVMDYGVYRTRLIMDSTFNPKPYYAAHTGSNLLLSALLLAAAWIAVRARALRWWIGIVTLVLGLIAVFYPLLLTLDIGLRSHFGIWRAESNFMSAGAFMAVLGVYALVKSYRAD